MRFGICAPVEKSSAIKAAGWDFVEENVQSLLQGNLPDDQWQGMTRMATCVLPCIAANCLVPGPLKITGPEADLDKLRAYMRNVLVRAQRVGIKTLVFGSGGARNVPDGFDRDRARQQIIEFVKMAAPLAVASGVTLVAEHLNRKECNIINSLDEAMTYVRQVNHPGFQCLVDSYHFWLEDEPLASLEKAGPFIRHVHLADKDGRVPPGMSGKSDYKPFFRVLKKAGYQGPISVEAIGVSAEEMMTPRNLEYLKTQWEQA